MWNKKRIIILIGYCILFVFGYALNMTSYATNTGNISLISNQERIDKGEEIEIIVYLDNAKTAAFDFSLYFDESKLDYISGPENTNQINNRILFVWYDKAGGSEAKEGELARFKFRTKEDGLATFTLQGEFYSETGQLIQTDMKEGQIQIGKEQTALQKQAEEEQGTDTQNSNAVLQVLRLDKEGLIPSFEKNVHEYYLTVSNNVSSIDVLAISENPNATTEITGNTDLKEGLNFITIRVTSVDKTQSSVYTIEVTKTANIELANTNLEILAIENVLLNPPFAIDETNYKAEVSNETETVNILAVPENEQAMVEISGKDNLIEGTNLVNIVVTAPNGFTKKKYQVEIYKRNLEEEQKYQEEQELQKEMLEHAYEIEELSTNSDKSSQEIYREEDTQKFNNLIMWTIILVIVILLIAGVFLYIKRKKR